MSQKQLCTSPLSVGEQQRLLGLLDALAGFLRSPGDWGYRTTLGELTINVFNARHEVRAAVMEESHV